MNAAPHENLVQSKDANVRLPHLRQSSNSEIDPETRSRTVPSTGGTTVSKFSARWFIAIAFVTISILGACAAVDAENSGGYSDSSLSGSFVFRARRRSRCPAPEECA